MFGSQPWSLQAGGCGERGLLLNLPFAFLTQSGTSLEHKGGWKAQNQICEGLEDSPLPLNIQKL